ncbi:MAG TPA: BON domain-containing protein, partial [Pseudoduganella sp.]
GLFAAAAFALASLSAHAQQEGAMAGAAIATADSTLQAKVKAALSDQKEIIVSANQGVVVLSGTVASSDAGAKAIQAASSVAGVKEVKSELTVAGK